MVLGELCVVLNAPCECSQTAVSVAGEAAGQAEKYIESAQPSISSTLDNVLSSDPLVLATGAGALLLLYFLAPPLLSNVSTAVRGFRGTCATVDRIGICALAVDALLSVTDPLLEGQGSPNGLSIRKSIPSLTVARVIY